MEEDIALILEDAESNMKGTLDFLHNQFSKIRTGKASPDMLKDVVVAYYGSPTPVGQVGNISVADPRMLTVTPWEKNMIPVIDKAIREAGLGLNPVSDGDLVRVPIPALNEERRRDLVKQAKSEGESAKVSLRSIRKSANDDLKDLQKDGAPEDAIKTAEGKVQEIINAYSKKIDELLKEKEAKIMAV